MNSKTDYSLVGIIFTLICVILLSSCKVRVSSSMKSVNFVSELRARNECTLVSRSINFEFGKSRIIPDSHLTLDSIVCFLKQHSHVSIEIGVHMAIFSEFECKDLSDIRAEVIKQYFTAKGINEDRIISIGYGGVKPLVICKDSLDLCCADSALKMNQRIEFKILKKVKFL